MGVYLTGCFSEEGIVYVFVHDTAFLLNCSFLYPIPTAYPKLEFGHFEVTESGDAQVATLEGKVLFSGNTLPLGESHFHFYDIEERVWFLLHDSDLSVYPVLIQGKRAEQDHCIQLDVVLFTSDGSTMTNHPGTLVVLYPPLDQGSEPLAFGVAYEFRMLGRPFDTLVGKGSLVGTRTPP